MNLLQKIGITYNKNTANKKLIAKVSSALILSNFFFYLLFGQSEEQMIVSPTDGVQIHLMATLRTPFQKGKKILLVNKNQGQKIEALLEDVYDEEEKIYTLIIAERWASHTLSTYNWEIYPYLKELNLNQPNKGNLYEIRY